MKYRRMTNTLPTQICQSLRCQHAIEQTPEVTVRADRVGTPMRTGKIQEILPVSKRVVAQPWYEAVRHTKAMCQST